MNHLFDPTKATFLSPPDDIEIYELSFRVEERFFASCQDTHFFTSLLVNGILNVGQVIKKEEKNLSISITPELVEERLSFQEILADIVLYQLITGDTDRLLLPSSSSKTNGKVETHNCLIFREGTYSIFDIYDFGTRIEKNDVIREIIKNIRNLYDNYFLDEIDFYDGLFLSPEENEHINIGKQGFFQRMLSKVDKFLERYDGEDGKNFFITQKKYSCPNEDNSIVEERYNNLIFTLQNIKKVISKENIREITLDFICTDFDFVKNDFKEHLFKTIELLGQLVGIVKSKVKSLISK